MISLEDWRLAGETFHYAGRPIFTRRSLREGAPPLVLIHGFPTSSWDWNRVWHRLAEHSALYTMDMLGFGDSAKPLNSSYQIVSQADLIEAWLSSEGLQEYHILAHDYGDTVTQELLARDNRRRKEDGGDGCRLRIGSVCLLNGGLFPETHRPAFIQRLLLSPIGPLVSRFTSRDKLARNLRRIFGPDTPPGEEEIDGFWQLICANEGRGIMHRLIGYMSQRRRHRSRWVGALQETRRPLHLINGSADPISGAHMVARYRQLVDSAGVTELAGIGHYPQLEAPGAVVQGYLEFRSTLSVAESSAPRETQEALV